jgi:flagellar protein FlbD
MIKLTRRDGSEMFLNPDLIEILEETPDTHITLSNGNRYLVLESAATIIDRIITLKAAILHRSSPAFKRKYLKRKRKENFGPFSRL